MHIIKTDGIAANRMSSHEAAREADRHARMLQEIYLDIEDLDPQTCPPSRRFYKGDKQAWIYDHGNVAELVFVRSDEACIAKP